MTVCNQEIVHSRKGSPDLIPSGMARALFRLVNHRLGTKDLVIGEAEEIKAALKYKGDYVPFPTFSGFLRINGIRLTD